MIPIERGREANAPPQQKEIGIARFFSFPFLSFPFLSFPFLFFSFLCPLCVCYSNTYDIHNRSTKLLETTKLFVIRRTSDILEKYLPSKIENIVFCPPTPLQKSLYNVYLKFDNQFLFCLFLFLFLFRCTDISSILKGSSSSALEGIINLRKLCNHPALVADKILEKSSVKVAAADDLDKV